jgi:hypothetical protein
VTNSDQVGEDLVADVTDESGVGVDIVHKLIQARTSLVHGVEAEQGDEGPRSMQGRMNPDVIVTNAC